MFSMGCSVEVMGSWSGMNFKMDTSRRSFGELMGMRGCCVAEMGTRVSRQTRSCSRIKEFRSSLWGKPWAGVRRPMTGSDSAARRTDLLRVRSKAGELTTRISSKLNLNQYMVTLDRPTGIRFAQLASGKIYVDALAKNGNAERAHIIMLGDILKKTSAESGDGLQEVGDLGQVMRTVKARNGPVSLMFERASQFFRSSISPGVGRVDTSGASQKLLNGDEESFEVIEFNSDEERPDIEWAHGDFNKDEYSKALKRAERDLSYNPALGIQYSTITEQIYVGSCIQEENDLHRLVERLGITAVLNLQRNSERENWGIDGEAIEKLAREKDIIFVNCPIRDVDVVDLRRKLPFAVGVLYRLLRQGHRVYVTCTTGLDRSPACVIAYLHWIQDVALQEALEYIKTLHPCGPDIPALVWATWDLIAMVEEGDHKGPPTHAVQFVWNHGCREGEDVLLVGEFKGGWNEPIKAVHATGPKYTVDLRLPQGKYNYKFIVGGHWRHSNSLPTEGDEWGNINNVLKIGDVATTKFDTPRRTHMKDLNTIRVIERPLTEDERFTLAFAARRLAFAIDPLTLESKKC